MSELAAAIAAAPASALWPTRHADRAAQGADLLDALAVGSVDDGEGYVAIVRTALGPLVVPGVLKRGTFTRAPVAHAALDQPSTGNFTIERFGELPSGRDEQPIDVDQSNESVVVGDQIVMKWQRIAASSGAPSRIRAILRAQRAGGVAPLIPQPIGLIEWQHDGQALLIASAARYLPDAQDGWAWAVEMVRDRLQDAVEPFVHLGEMTAQMHGAFAVLGVAQADRSEIDAWLHTAQAFVARAESVIDGPEGERLAGFAPRIRSELQTLSAIEHTPIMAIHGDYHVGQVLRSRNELLITDFDGNPILPPAERGQHQPAARDVAGMLASIDHVARVVIYRNPDVEPGPVRAWIPIAQAAFLDAYRDALAAAGFADLFDARLLTPFQLEQECREYVYSAEHLPHWRYVPDAVLSERYGTGGR